MPLTFMSGSYRQGGRPSSVLVKPTPTSTLFSLLGMAAAAKAAFAAMTVAAVAASAPPLSVLGIVDRYAPSDTTLLDNGAMAIEQDFAFYHHNTAHQQEGGGSTDPSSPTTTTMASFSEENAADGRRDTFFSPQWASPADAFGYYRRSSFSAADASPAAAAGGSVVTRKRLSAVLNSHRYTAFAVGLDSIDSVSYADCLSFADPNATSPPLNIEGDSSTFSGVVREECTLTLHPPVQPSSAPQHGEDEDAVEEKQSNLAPPRPALFDALDRVCSRAASAMAKVSGDLSGNASATDTASFFAWPAVTASGTQIVIASSTPSLATLDRRPLLYAVEAVSCASFQTTAADAHADGPARAASHVDDSTEHIRYTLRVRSLRLTQSQSSLPVKTCTLGRYDSALPHPRCCSTVAHRPQRLSLLRPLWKRARAPACEVWLRPMALCSRRWTLAPCSMAAQLPLARAGATIRMSVLRTTHFLSSPPTIMRCTPQLRSVRSIRTASIRCCRQPTLQKSTRRF